MIILAGRKPDDMRQQIRIIQRRLQLIVEEALSLITQNTSKGSDQIDSVSCFELESRLLMSASPAAAADPDSLAAEVSPPQDTSEFTAINREQESSQHQSHATHTAPELVVIDQRVENFQSLILDLESRQDRHFELLLLNPESDGIQQITEAIQRYQQITALHLISHGSAGEVQLGSSTLSEHNVTRSASDLAVWRDGLSGDRDLLIYGCDLAADTTGQMFIQKLAEVLQADVAVSTDLTGSASRGGDWDLEYEIGSVTTQLAITPDQQYDWPGLLATINVNQTNDVVNGDTSSIASLIADDGGDGISLREAILAANQDDSADTIQLGPGVYSLSIAGGGEDLALRGDLDIREDLTITGSGEDSTVIDASSLTGAAADRVFHLLNDANVEFSGIRITGGSGVAGAGVLLNGAESLTILESTITGNHVGRGHGGGIFNADGRVRLTDVTLSNNSASEGFGGGIHNRSELTLNNVTISGNSAAGGGGIYAGGTAATTTLNNVTLSGNTASWHGGGLLSSRDVTVSSSTVAYNRATAGAGISSGPSEVQLRNSILAHNTQLDGVTPANVAGVIVSQGHNIDTDGTARLDQPGDLTGVDPLLDPDLANHGGSTATHLLQPGSPAIDAGHLQLSPAADQRGLLRGSRPDIGAVESNPVTFRDVSAYSVSIADDSPQLTSRAEQGSQRAVAISATGQYVVVWSSDQRQGSAWGVNARIFGSNGNPLTSVFQVEQRTTSDQIWAGVAADAFGNFVVTWTSERHDGTLRSIYARRFDSTGAALTDEFRVNVTRGGLQRNSSIAMNSSGEFVIVWEGHGPRDSRGVYARKYSASGDTVGPDIRVNDVITGNQKNPNVAIDADGAFVVTWEDEQGVHAQTYDSSGRSHSDPIQVDSTPDAHHPDVAINRAGRFVVTWHRDEGQFASDSTAISGKDVYQRSFAWDGTEFSPASVVNSQLFGDQRNASVAADADGNYIIAWQGEYTGSHDAIYFQRFDSTGNRIGEQTQTSDSVTANEQYASVQTLNPDHLVVVWTGVGSKDVESVYARQFGTSYNHAPVAATPSEWSIDEGQSLRLHAGTSSDPDGDALTFAWDIDNDGIYDDAFGSEPVISWKDLPAEIQQPGTYSVSVRVTDTGGAGDTADSTLTVLNVAPTLTSPTQVSMAEASLTVQSVATSDPGGSVTYSLTGGNDRDRFRVDSVSGTLTFQAAPDFENPADSDANNVYEVEVTVSDGNGGIDSHQVHITVLDQNDTAPVIPSGQTFEVEHSAVVDTVVGTVAATAGHHAAQLSDWQITAGNSDGIFAIDPDTGRITVADAAQPGFQSPASYQLFISVGDGTHTSSSVPVTVNVIRITQPPSVSPIPDYTGTEDEASVTLSVSPYFTFPEAVTPQFSIRVTNEDGLTFENLSVNDDGIVRFRSGPDDFGTATLLITATAPGDLSISAEFRVTVFPQNDRPTVENIELHVTAGETIIAGAPGLLTHAADVDGDLLTAVLVSPPSHGTLELSHDGSFSWTPDSGFSGTDRFAFAVSDGDLSSHPATVTITVDATPDADENLEQSGAAWSELKPEPNRDRSDRTDRTEQMSDSDGDSTSDRTTDGAAYTELTSRNSADDDDLDRKGLAARIINAQDRRADGPTIATLPKNQGSSAFFGPEIPTATGVSSANHGSTSGSAAPSSQHGPGEGHSESSLRSSVDTSRQPLRHQLYSQLIRQNGMFNQGVETLRNTVGNRMSYDVVVLNSAAAVGSGLAVGSVVWAVRGGLLLTGLLAQMPAWTMLDPLLVLDGVTGDDGEGDSIRDIVDRQRFIPTKETAETSR